MKQITGIIEGKRRLFSWKRKLEILVGDTKFYTDFPIPDEYIGRKVFIEYNEVILSFPRWVFENILSRDYSIRRNYNKITFISIGR